MIKIIKITINGPVPLDFGFQNDINLYYWNKFDGYGYGTPLGKTLSYKYGAFIKKRYEKFLNPIFNNKRVYAKVFDVTSHFESSYSFLAGLFRPSDIQKWNNNTHLSHYIPISVHSNDRSTDNVRNLKIY